MEKPKLTVTVKPRPRNDVDELEKKVNDYIGETTMQSDELIVLLSDFLSDYNAMKEENVKVKELLLGMLSNPLMGSVVDNVKQKLKDQLK